MIYISLLYLTVWYMQAILRLNPRWWCACILWVLLLLPARSRSDMYDSARSNEKHSYSAIVNITFKDSTTGESKSEKMNGRYGLNSLVDSETGIVVHVRSGPPNSAVTNYGCHPLFENEIPSERWVALIERGECQFSDKIKNAAKKYNASAVVIYNNVSDNSKDVNMEHEGIET